MKTLVERIKKVKVIYKPLYWLYVKYLTVKKRFIAYKHRQRSFSLGEEHPDKTFYVIGVPYTTAGLFAIVKSIFCHICYAVQHSYVPVVDMLNFNSQLSDVDELKKKNVWELYFQQPGGYRLEDIRASRNVIESCSLPFPDGVQIGFDTPIDDNLHNKFHHLYCQYVVPNSAMKKYSVDKFKSVIGDRKNVLGVLCRGTDYTDSKPSGHPIQPTAEQAIVKAKEIMSQYGYEYIFLATEDRRIFSAFKEQFGDRLLFSGQKLYAGMEGKRFLSEISVTDYSERWHNTVDYYSTIYILSKCDGLIAGLTCGSICAYLMSSGYKYSYFWNLGKYK